MKAFRAAAVLGTVVASIVLPVRPAAADVGLGAGLVVNSGTVGQTGRAGSLTIRNTNTGAQFFESNIVTQIRMAPSCGTASTDANLCSLPDPGVLSVASVATGRAGTTCAGRTFAVSAPDASGFVTFTPTGGQLLLPPQDPATPGDDVCTVDFTYSVLKSPTVDSDPNAGLQTRLNVLITVQSQSSAQVVSVDLSAPVTVFRSVPMLATSASRNAATGTISDTATVTRPAGSVGPTPTGTVTFRVYGPDDATCVGPVFATSTNTLAGGSATSAAFPVSQPGTYRFVATYNGDANYVALPASCNAPNENVVVPRRAVADFDGNGTTDRSVYRDGAWYVHGQPTVLFGLAGYTPVPADYDGGGDTERAVYKDGAWYVEGQPTVYFGLPGDIPVPGDYDGNGDAERAVYRPSAGGWYVEGLAPVFFGTADSIPVPGDYDGNGTIDRAVFIDGGWYVQGQSTVYLGLPGYIPVPGDYDGNGTTDRAVFDDGAWYVHNRPTVFFGVAGDIPQPGDYDGNGTTDRAVYRNGAWYTQGRSTVFWGVAGDIPLPLPHAIRTRFS